MPQLGQALGIDAGDVLPFVQDLPVGGFQQVNQHTAQGGFPAAGFAHDAQCGSLFNMKVQVIHRMQGSGAYIEIFLQMLYFQNISHRNLPYFSARWQRTKCPGETSVNSGVRCSHISQQCSQRGANLQCGGRLAGSGIRPWMGLRRLLVSS